MVKVSITHMNCGGGPLGLRVLRVETYVPLSSYMSQSQQVKFQMKLKLDILDVKCKEG
jgi:hypothetical protein